jgi:hypothetical protein
MGYYSFRVFSKNEVDLPEHLVTIGEGQDTFQARVDDLDSFTAYLSLEGVSVLSVHQLDALEAIDPIPEIKAGLIWDKLPPTGTENERKSILGPEDDDIR